MRKKTLLVCYYWILKRAKKQSTTPTFPSQFEETQVFTKMNIQLYFINVFFTVIFSDSGSKNISSPFKCDTFFGKAPPSVRFVDCW